MVYFLYDFPTNAREIVIMKNKYFKVDEREIGGIFRGSIKKDKSKEDYHGMHMYLLLFPNHKFI